MDKGLFIIVGAGDILPGDLSSHLLDMDQLPLIVRPMADKDHPSTADTGENNHRSIHLPENFLCAADAGYLSLIHAGLNPDLIIGDFDSMDKPDADCELIQLPVVKDDTDISYCIKEGFRRGYSRFLILGALGGARISHSLANIQLLTMVKDLGGQAVLSFGDTRLTVMNPGERITFPDSAAGTLSVFSLSEESTLSLSGLFYPLDHGKLSRHFPLGVSNHFTGQDASVELFDGQLLVVWETSAN